MTAGLHFSASRQQFFPGHGAEAGSAGAGLCPCQIPTAEARLNPLDKQRPGKQTELGLICCLLTFLIRSTAMVAPCRAQPLLGELFTVTRRDIHSSPPFRETPLLCAGTSCLVLPRNTTRHSCSSQTAGNTYGSVWGQLRNYGQWNLPEPT